jgi:hypothetical protein
MKRLASVVIVAVLVVLPGCTRDVPGTAAVGPRAVDPAFFFAGPVPNYALRITPQEGATLTYLRALRRIDPCGLLTREALARIGEIGSVGTLFAFDECDIDIKVPGRADRRYVSVEVVLTRVDGPSAFQAAGLPVSETMPGSCQYLLPLDLSRLPGAPALSGPLQPFVRIGLIADDDCAFTRQLVEAVAPDVGALRLPARDALAAYPLPLAERDPCQVLSVIGREMTTWNITRGRPYVCDFTLRDNMSGDTPVQVELKPAMYDLATDTRTQQVRDGVSLLVDEAYCSAVAFLDTTPMRRKLLGGDFVAAGDVVIRPAVVAEGPGEHCDLVADVAARAAKLYI